MNSFNTYDPRAYLEGSECPLFRREEDLLNVFHHNTQYYHLDDNFNFNQEFMGNSIFNDRSNDHTCNEKSMNSPKYCVPQGYDSFADLVESVEATVDNLESFEYQKENCVYYTKRQSEIESSIKNDAQETKSVFLHCREITSIAVSDLNDLDAVTSIPTKKVVEANDDKPISLNKSKRVKLFSRRKDVIIKTLLRKCRKFFLKDFNAKTNYLKTAKRKFGSSVYKTLIELYLNRVFANNQSEDLLMFMAAFLYPQDMEDSIESFVSSTYDYSSIKALLVQIHEILYKYSHQKFSGFSQNPEFKILFIKFDEMGSEVHKIDNEYAAGFEIIKDQLQ